MLYEFIDANRDEIIARARDRMRRRQWPSVGAESLKHGFTVSPACCIPSTA